MTTYPGLSGTVATAELISVNILWFHLSSVTVHGQTRQDNGHSNASFKVFFIDL